MTPTFEVMGLGLDRPDKRVLYEQKLLLCGH